MTTAYLEMLIEARSELEGPTPEAWFDRLELEEDKLDAALKEACQHDPAVGLRAAPLLQRFWFARGRLGRGRQWVEQLLSAAGEARTVEKREGNLAQAEANLREAITISREINNSYILAGNLITLAAVKMAAGQARQAARLLGHADAIYLSTGLVVDPADKADYDQTLTSARSELGEAAFAATHADGAALSIERLIATL